jgi:hypothetical protein
VHLNGLILTIVALAGLMPAAQKATKVPEAFSANAQVAAGAGAAATTLGIHIERYTTEKERTALVQAAPDGTPASISGALRGAPAVGYIEVGKNKWTICYAREQKKTDGGRHIVVVVNKPMFFLGGGQLDAKSREGYDLAVAQFDVDEVGLGQGTLAAAARLKATEATGVEVLDYADAPIKLVTVRKLIS